jgi:hypothetical protein
MAHTGYPEGAAEAAISRATIKSARYQMNNQDSTNTTTTQQNRLATLSPEERKLIAWLEAGDRELTPQEINLSLRQARELGEL